MNRILSLFRLMCLSLFFGTGVFLLGILVGQGTFSAQALMNWKNIHNVAAAGDYEATRGLLDEGVSANTVDSFLQTPLLHAAWWGHEKVVVLLIERGVNVNTQNTEGFTGLYWAVNHGHYRIAEILLKAGAKTNVYSVNEWTPLHEAAVHGDDRMYHLLIKYGADEDVVDRWGQTPRGIKEARKQISSF